MAIVSGGDQRVPELDKGQVTVVSQNGLLSDQQELSELTMASEAVRLHPPYGNAVAAYCCILQPVLGTGRYKAEVSADAGFILVESRQSANPDQPALLPVSNRSTNSVRAVCRRKACRARCPINRRAGAADAAADLAVRLLAGPVAPSSRWSMPTDRQITGR